MTQKPSKIWALTSLLAIALSVAFMSTSARAADPAQILPRVLIVGASVSYGYDPTNHGVQPDPATILATRYGFAGGIVKHAIPGANSAKILPLLKQSEFDRSTIAIGVDLFFWDSILSGRECDQAVARVGGLATAVKAKKAPWILGRIPDLGFQQGCREALNQRIDEACAADADCRLLDFEKVTVDIASQGGMMIDGHFYTPREIQPDGVHLSAVASKWVADLMAKAVRGDQDPYLVYGPQSH